MKEKLIVENLFGNTNLDLEVGEATFKVLDNTLTITVIFPVFYEPGDLKEDQDGEIINPPEDYWFKESEATLEVEFPFSGTIEDLLEKEIYIDSEDEDNDDLTNFYIANTHYPTFDDKILITRTENSFTLNWSGIVPDIKNSRYEVFMKKMFRFKLISNCILDI